MALMRWEEMAEGLTRRISATATSGAIFDDGGEGGGSWSVPETCRQNVRSVKIFRCFSRILVSGTSHFSLLARLYPASRRALPGKLVVESRYPPLRTRVHTPF